MKYLNRNTILFLSGLILFGLILLFSILRLPTAEKNAGVLEKAADSQPAQVANTASNGWNDLLEMEPVAYSNSLPAPTQSPLDGTYTKIDSSWPQWWLCKRCADYRAAGGIWKIQFDKGVMRIFYEMTGWRSVASFAVSDDRLTIFNDPYCSDVSGEYTWQLENGHLNLEVINDACSFELRGKNLSKQPWTSCTSSAQAETKEQSSELPGCAENLPVPPPVSSSDLGVTVEVYGGDSRFFETPPDIIAFANSADKPSPDGIDVRYHAESIPYGVQRVLWWEGDWVQADTELLVTSMGVQFLGDPPIGWARVLFDGEEVWRGDTSAIWSKHGRHGGYIEISGFEPGPHQIRAESLGFDYRPVTVAGFGFSYEDGVSPE